MSSTPAAQPPEGQVANFDNPETSYRIVGMVLAIVGMVIMSSIMILRMYTKTILIHLFGIDDVFASLAWIASIVQQSLYIYLWASKHLGVHTWDLTVTELNTFTRVLSVCGVFGVLTTNIAKTALLLSYRKMWLVKWFKVTTYVGLVFIFSYTTAFALTLIFPCVPLARSWDITITTGHCLDKNKLYIGTAACSAVTDVLIFVLPMPMVYNLRLRPFQKAGMILMFAIASLTIIVNMVFMGLLVPLVQRGVPDGTWSMSRIITIVTVEANLVLICGCFPALKLFARRVAPRLLGTERESAAGEVVVVARAGVLPSLWETELTTITTGISGESSERKDSAKSSGGVQIPPKTFDYNPGTMFSFDGVSGEQGNKRTLGQVLPDP